MRIGRTANSGPVLAYDPGGHRLYAAAESGWPTALDNHDHRLTVTGRAHLADGAHVVAVDPGSHDSYHPVPHGSGGQDRAALDATGPATEGAGGAGADHVSRRHPARGFDRRPGSADLAGQGIRPAMRVDFDPQTTFTQDFDRLLTAVVVPRPIAWVSTVSESGTENLAPAKF